MQKQTTGTQVGLIDAVDGAIASFKAQLHA
jgi:hypothetical protein